MLFEKLIIGLFCCAVGARLIQHIRRKTCADGCERFTLFTIGVSSVIGIIGKCYSENQWSAMLYCMGAYLIYIAFLFSWPSKISERDKGVGNYD